MLTADFVAWVDQNVIPKRHLHILHEYLKIKTEGKSGITDQDLREVCLPGGDVGNLNFQSRFWSGHGTWVGSDCSPESIRSHENSYFDEDLEYLFMRGYLFVEKELVRNRDYPVEIKVTYKTCILFKDIFPQFYRG